LEDLKKMSSELLGARVLERADNLREKEAAAYNKKKKAIRKKWKGRGKTGEKEEYNELSAARKKFMSDSSITDDSHKDWVLAYKYGKDAPKAKSFMTPKSPGKAKPKAKAKAKKNPTPYSDEILKGAGKYNKKGGGAVRQGRGMGAALRGGGAVTRS